MLTLDYFLWGCVKSHFYADKPETIAYLIANIRRDLAEIKAVLFPRVCQNWTSRLSAIHFVGINTIFFCFKVLRN